jgi:hypothetical protein
MRQVLSSAQTPTLNPFRGMLTSLQQRLAQGLQRTNLKRIVCKPTPWRIIYMFIF